MTPDGQIANPLDKAANREPFLAETWPLYVRRYKVDRCPDHKKLTMRAHPQLTRNP
jgi:hypothetical protein